MLLMIASKRLVSKRGEILVGELLGRFAGAGVEVDRAAADLRCGHVHVAAVLLQHAGRGPVDVAEHGVADAAGEEGDRGTAAADGRQELRAAGLRCDAAAAACRPCDEAAAAAGM